jgi:SAM-dependent methyltransferase
MQIRSAPGRWATRIVSKVAPSQQMRVLRSRLNPARHRWATGGGWDEIGRLQLQFLVDQGLRPEHHLLDVGCGGLRGGRHFVAYLDAAHYCGMDKNGAFLRGGARELRASGLADKGAVLLQDDAFRFSRFGRRFDYALAVSVFTHLPFNAIMRCLSEMQDVLHPGGAFFTTFLPNTGRRLRHDDIPRAHRDLHLDRDPYYYDPDIFRWAVEGSTLRFTLHGDWGHPRGQQMLVFRKDPDTE